MVARPCRETTRLVAEQLSTVEFENVPCGGGLFCKKVTELHEQLKGQKKLPPMVIRLASRDMVAPAPELRIGAPIERILLS